MVKIFSKNELLFMLLIVLSAKVAGYAFTAQGL